MRREIGKIQKVADAIAALHRKGSTAITDVEVAEAARLELADVTATLDHSLPHVWGKLPLGLMAQRTHATPNVPAGLVVSRRESRR